MKFQTYYVKVRDNPTSRKFCPHLIGQVHPRVMMTDINSGKMFYPARCFSPVRSIRDLAREEK